MPNANEYKQLTHSGEQIDAAVDAIDAMQTAIAGKVDKVSGKQLSTNDFTNAEKQKLAGLSNYNDSELRQEISDLQSGKVDKVSGKQLSTEDFTAAYKAKLEGLSNYDDTELRGDLASETTARENADLALSAEIAAKQNALTFDTDPTADSTNPVTSGGVYTDQQRQEAEIGAVANAGAKNIVNNTAAETTTQSGITWTRNPDGSVSASGTSTGVSAIRVVGVQGSSAYSSAVPIPKGKYIISASGFSLTRYRVVIGFFADENSARQTTNVYNEEVTIEVTTDTARYDLSCVIAQSGETMDGETWYPMIRSADIKDDTFVPYAPTNRELYEMILALQSGGASTQSVQSALMTKLSSNELAAGETQNTAEESSVKLEEGSE